LEEACRALLRIANEAFAYEGITSNKLRAMPGDFFDPTPEEQKVVLIDAATLRKAEKLIESCAQCNPIGAEIPFDNILDRVSSDPSVMDYILKRPTKCPNCKREILEKTLVEPV
jgi:hypothetical protein